jgi:MYXO-CTERM domain-containing protein
MRRAGTMKPIAVAAVLTVIALTDRSVRAQEYETCCDTAVRASGSCVAQNSPCASSAGYAIGFTGLPANAVDSDWGSDSGVLGAFYGPGEGDAAGPNLSAVGIAFPSGVDGYMTTSTLPPWEGLCLDAPSTQDPMHQGPTEPVACLAASLLPGVSAQLAVFQFPVDARWDAYQLCYGLPSGGADAAAPCENVDDMDDPSISPTPVSGSCCSPVHVLTAQNAESAQEWSVQVSQEIPGVPPPVIVVGPDGGPSVFYDPDAGDDFAAVPSRCLAAYGEPSQCGQPPAATDASLVVAACVPTTCAAQGASCSVIPDGCGGTLNCATNCAPEAKGTLGCTTSPTGAGGGVVPGVWASLAAVAIAWTRRRKRRLERSRP